KAIQTYARQGGASSIFVHDDGLQIVSEEEREARIAFYANHNIGWVARPKHDGAPGGFKRAGRFKKASNMNYGLALSLKLEKHLKGACGGHRAGRVRRGRDCFRDATCELAECPEVAIIHHGSDVMQVVFHYFENGIAHFTRRINKCISIGCANGDVAPPVGRNAFLRWSALQDAAFVDCCAASPRRDGRPQLGGGARAGRMDCRSPAGWAVLLPIGIVMGCHILFPIVLNPWPTIFSY
ncbi:hypothetical protein BU15DRAFT_83685, partial [Melanogaster broomeanus]